MLEWVECDVDFVCVGVDVFEGEDCVFGGEYDVDGDVGCGFWCGCVCGDGGV